MFALLTPILDLGYTFCFNTYEFRQKTKIGSR